MEKKQSTLSIAIGMACVWMGTHFGPGVASGTQILVYWVKYGIWGALASVLAMCLLGYCIYCAAAGPRRSGESIGSYIFLTSPSSSLC